jgi:PAS domain S-box-containing protein
LDILPEHVAAPSHYMVSQAIATGEMQSLEYQLPIDGMTRTYEARIVPSQSEEVLAVVRDITSLDPVLMAERQAELDFRAMFGDCQEAIAVVHWGTVMFANAALANMFGYESAASLKGCYVLDLIAEQGRIAMERRMRSRAVAQPTQSAFRTRGLRRDASTFALEIRESEYQQNGRMYWLLRLRDMSQVWAAAACVSSRSIDVEPAGRGSDAVRNAFDDILTAREVQVLVLIAIGQSTKQIAATLGIAYKTADAHRTHLMEKLGVHETASIVRYAIRAGLVEP